MKFKIGETVYIKGKKGKISDYSDVSHRYKVKLAPGQYAFLRDAEISKENESWRK